MKPSEAKRIADQPDQFDLDLLHQAQTALQKNNKGYGTAKHWARLDARLGRLDTEIKSREYRNHLIEILK